jgi:FkbM family methyltransferase
LTSDTGPMNSGIRHHKLIATVSPCNQRAPDGFELDFLGIRTRRAFHGPRFASPSPILSDASSGRTLPFFEEEYLEWVDLFEAISNARDIFTMAELGAGYGRWLVRGATVAHLFGGLVYRAVGVEAEPTHFEWMKQHFFDNGLDPSSHELIQAAVTDRDGTVKFYTGSAGNWYGQCIPTWKNHLASLARRIRYGKSVTWLDRKVGAGSFPYSLDEVKAVSLTTLLKSIPRVDLIDMDVQGAEFNVLNRDKETLDEKVKRVHIGTHNRRVERQLRSMFDHLGWVNRFDFACGRRAQTEWGAMDFQDGVQTWTNPDLRSS